MCRKNSLDHRRLIVQGIANDVQFRMLITHRDSNILVSHDLHYSGEISSLSQHAGSKIVPAGIQNQVLSESRFIASCAIKLSHRSQVAF